MSYLIDSTGTQLKFMLAYEVLKKTSQLFHGDLVVVTVDTKFRYEARRNQQRINLFRRRIDESMDDFKGRKHPIDRSKAKVTRTFDELL